MTPPKQNDVGYWLADLSYLTESTWCQKPLEGYPTNLTSRCQLSWVQIIRFTWGLFFAAPQKIRLKRASCRASCVICLVLVGTWHVNAPPNWPLLDYAAYDICFKLIETTNHLDIKTTIFVVFQPFGLLLLISGQPVACHDLTKWKSRKTVLFSHHPFGLIPGILHPCNIYGSPDPTYIIIIVWLFDCFSTSWLFESQDIYNISNYIIYFFGGKIFHILWMTRFPLLAARERVWFALYFQDSQWCNLHP